MSQTHPYFWRSILGKKVHLIHEWLRYPGPRDVIGPGLAAESDI